MSQRFTYIQNFNQNIIEFVLWTSNCIKLGLKLYDTWFSYPEKSETLKPLIRTLKMICGTSNVDEQTRRILFISVSCIRSSFSTTVRAKHKCLLILVALCYGLLYTNK